MTHEPPTLVLLPGLDGTGDLFAPLLEALGDKLETIVVRYPLDEPLDYAGLLARARSAIPAGQPYVILAESFSGPIGIALAAEASPDLRGLILCGSFARNPRPALGAFEFCLRWIPINAALVRIGIAAMLDGAVDPVVRGLIQRTVARIPKAILRTRLRAVLRIDVTPELAKVDAPILYLQAAQDRGVPPAAATLIRQIRPGANVVTIEGPHFLLQTSPHLAAAEITRFANAASIS